jgi:hypothetical protein
MHLMRFHKVEVEYLLLRILCVHWRCPNVIGSRPKSKSHSQHPNTFNPLLFTHCLHTIPCPHPPTLDS